MVIDEQHRFGVGQRLLLTQKGKVTPHCLAMTATPIPRTLTLAQYGEMDVSRLDEMPPGRQAIDTRVVALDRLADVVDGVARHLESGQQAYWVCPMVRGASTKPTTSPRPRRASRRSRRGSATRSVLVHGQLKPELKDAAMERFASGDAKLLVATTVIEVGRRRARRDADGDRAGRTLRPRPAPPAARPRRARQRQVGLPAAARRGTVRNRPRSASR